MKLVAGILADQRPAVQLSNAELIHFSLASDRVGERALLESCFASPGRFVGEMVHRLRASHPTAARYLVFNPYLAPHAAILDVVAAATLGDDEWSGVVADIHGRALAYVFDAVAVDDLPPVHLGLLSTNDAALDARFLRASIGECRLRRVPLAAAHSPSAANGFHPLSPALANATRHAAELLEAVPNEFERRRRVREGARAAVVGYHAGDVLFWLQALDLEETRFDAMVVLDAFADIVRLLRPDLTCLAIDHPMPYRGDYHPRDEQLVLWNLVEELERRGSDRPRFWHLLRPFRDYRRTQHHLRESMAFALGGGGHGLRAPVATPVTADSPTGTRVPGRIVVHFEGGWALKEYPPERRAELLRLLVDAGYAPVILGRAEPAAPAIPAVPYSGLSRFRELLGSSDALIGCDSFPAHFAQALQVPTVQLFGSTRAHNSRGCESATYRFLQHPMSCVPCNDLNVCKVDGGNSCHAHATPVEVYHAVRELLSAHRGHAEHP
jgi:hypothetical protein